MRLSVRAVAGQQKDFGASCAVTACFSTSSFATPTDFNAYARNAFRAPGYFNTDMNLKKTFAFRERYRFMIGVNALNILKHPNFQNPVATNLSSAFGTINAVAVSPTTPYGAFASAVEGMRIAQVFAKILLTLNPFIIGPGLCFSARSFFTTEIASSWCMACALTVPHT